jgi:pimeloyl-ACP methyl ester carboxylesterase
MAERSLGSKIAIASVAAAAGLVVATAVGAAAVASVVARKVITPPRKREYDIRVLGYTDSTITLSATADTLTKGRYGLWFNDDAGHMRVGEIVSRGDGYVIRSLLAVDRGDISTAHRARFSGWFYLTPRELGFEVEDITIDAPVGPAPAWLVPAESGTDDWVIQVHGRGVTRAETIRAVPVFRAAGYTSLLVSYRNDSVAPYSEDRRYALGGTEWRDVEAAIEFAVGRGATSIVLMGWSMGGATSLQTALLSPHRELFRGLVLESAVVDWRSVLDFQAGQQKVPLAVRLGALQLLGSTWGKPFTGQSQPIDLDSLNIVRRAHELTLPTLLMHSADDGYVPIDAARELAILRPDLISYEEFTGARHAKLWNYDPERFDRVISEWLLSLRAASGRTARSRRRPEAASE